MEPSSAASVVLLRPGILGPQVLLLKRHPQAKFFGGAYVFPGGRVDASDRGLGRCENLDREGLQYLDDAEAVASAAARELFEEACILLGRGKLELELPHLRSSATTFREVLDRTGVEPLFELVPLSRWITPSSQGRRFDTLFFLGKLPDQQQAVCDGVETIDELWLSPSAALGLHDRGQLLLPPPTYKIFEELADFEGDEDAWLEQARKRPIHPVLPKVARSEDGMAIHLAHSAEYRSIDGDGLDLPATAPERRYRAVHPLVAAPSKPSRPSLAQVTDTLEFWFGGNPESVPEELKVRWWKKDVAWDAEITRRFGQLHEQLSSTELADDWKQTPEGRLALLLVLDQFSRNMFRGSERAFSCDEQALALALEGIELGHDLEVHPSRRSFFYLPLMHSENLEMQQACLRAMTLLAEEHEEIRASLKFTQQHLDLIERFGRFPHRNSVLGRVSTAEEEHFLEHETGFKG